MSSQLDQLYKRLNDDLEIDPPRIEDSEIAKFFAGKTLFITGVTGFMGKCLLEKLLRSCPEIKRIYVLMRDKKNQGLDERIKSYFGHEIFGPLRKINPRFEEKVTVIKGDLILENMGISTEDRNILINEVNIIYHNAANVKFEARVNVSFTINILGTKYMLDLAQECKCLELFMYVSTAYSHCYRKDIDETFYSISDTIDKVYDTIKRDTETENGLSEEAVKSLIGKCPNIYVYTKSFAEELVRQYSKDSNKFAYGIFRPSIVISSYREPLNGWCGNVNGPVYLFLGVGLGIIHVGYYLGYPMDLIPVDMAINSLIAVTWNLGKLWKPTDKPSIYNYGSSTLNPILLNKLYEPIKSRGSTEGSSKAVWLNTATETRSKFIFWTLNVMLHLIPACIGDVFLLLTGRKTIFVSIWIKAYKNMDKLDYFSNGDWRIHCPETMKVLERMNDADKEIFHFDIRKLYWEDYIFNLWRGMRYFTLKESLNSNAGRRKYVLNWYIHYTFVTICLLVFCYYMMKIFNFSI